MSTGDIIEVASRLYDDAYIQTKLCLDVDNGILLVSATHLSDPQFQLLLSVNRQNIPTIGQFDCTAARCSATTTRIFLFEGSSWSSPSLSIQRNGAASLNSDSISLTTSYSQYGSFFVNQPFSTKQSFETTFTFRMDKPWDSLGYADGLAFVFQSNSPISLTNGMFGCVGMTKSVAVVLNAYLINYQEVLLNGNDGSPAIKVETAGEYDNGGDHTVQVLYEVCFCCFMVDEAQNQSKEDVFCFFFSTPSLS